MIPGGGGRENTAAAAGKRAGGGGTSNLAVLRLSCVAYVTDQTDFIAFSSISTGKDGRFAFKSMPHSSPGRWMRDCVFRRIRRSAKTIAHFSGTWPEFDIVSSPRPFYTKSHKHFVSVRIEISRFSNFRRYPQTLLYLQPSCRSTLHAIAQSQANPLNSRGLNHIHLHCIAVWVHFKVKYNNRQFLYF